MRLNYFDHFFQVNLIFNFCLIINYSFRFQFDEVVFTFLCQRLTRFSIRIVFLAPYCNCTMRKTASQQFITGWFIRDLFTEKSRSEKLKILTFYKCLRDRIYLHR